MSPGAAAHGELPRPAAVASVDPLELLEGTLASEEPTYDPATGLPSSLRAFVVVREPRMLVVPHFFSGPECDHLVQLAEGFWMPSLVGQATHRSEEDYGKGDLENELSGTRTSWSCMLRYAQTDVVERLEHRLASLAGLPTARLERMNAVRYAPGEFFDEHHDGKFRPITIFVYLNELPEDDEAGDTFFPYLGLSFKPRRGAAIMWSNVDGEQEDGRMLHTGRAPTKGVKYGVNCFFNVSDMRLLTQIGADITFEQAAVVHVADLGNPSGSGGGGGVPRGTSECVAYRLVRDPQVVAVPNFVSATEAEHLWELAAMDVALACTALVAPDGARHVFPEATRTLCTLQAAGTPEVQAIEARLVKTVGLSLDHLAPLRVVRACRRQGLCNRGCGPKAAYICLSEADEVFFKKLGLRIVLRRGDLVFWPNVSWDTGTAVEDLRTERVHIPPGAGTSGPGEKSGSAEVVGIDAFFHDNPLREQQRRREFVSDTVASAV